MRILLVDDDHDSRRHVANFLRDLGHAVTECGDGDEALERFRRECFPMVLSDIKMPTMSGLELLKTIKAADSNNTSIVLFTGHSDMDSAITALRSGAYDYLLKPINVEELAIITEKIAQYHALGTEPAKPFAVQTEAAIPRADLAKLRKLVSQSIGMEHIGIFSETMQSIIEQACKYHTDRTIPVLIQGETGTGKEIIARLIHSGNHTGTGPFMDINCPAITATLFESEMFGYEEGSFTGSLRGGRPGKIELAYGGTLFLDEVSEIPLELQGKLLRVIQEKELYRVGGARKIKTDIRIICATNTDLAACVQTRKFRQDLYYRLQGGIITIPPLRNRKNEILPFALHFMKLAREHKKKQFAAISQEAAHLLTEHSWPGNIRELKNLIEWIVFMYDEKEIRPQHLKMITEPDPDINSGENILNTKTYNLPEETLDLDRYMRDIVHKALKKFGGNKTKTAQYLGISRSSLSCRLKKTPD